VATGFAALDAELPGGGWPHRVLTELLLAHPGVGEMRLLAPALAAISRGVAAGETGAIAPSRCIMLFDPPAALAACVLGQLGVDLQQTIIVYGREGARGAAMLRRLLPSADVLWAMEQALRSGQVGAVLAWPPHRLRADAVRRLQLAAARHDGPVFFFRDLRARLEASPAPLRLALHAAGPGGLSVHLLKRRGPALLRPLAITLPSVLPPALHGRWQHRWQANSAANTAATAADAAAYRG
jgi:protein ImuA